MPMRRTVLMICDGLRADLVRDELCPAIADLGREGTAFRAHRSVFPSVTRTSSASMATGHPPAGHGLHGNTMALPRGEGYAVHNVGDPAFVGAMRDALGRTLRVPAMAERLKAHGGSILFSNVSPGAAYFHDPDGHGHVYHRTGSYGPGLSEVPDPLSVSHDAAGDAAMTARFCDEVLTERRPRHAALWLSDPDKTMHASVLGSPAHLAALRGADACVARVAETVARLRDAGEDILFLLGSDHGQESTRHIVPVERLIFEAGFKRALDSDDIVVAPQGTSALIYAAASVSEDRVGELAAWLNQQAWCGAMWGGETLHEVGLAEEGGLRIAISMAKSPEANRHGMPGLSDVAVRFDKSEGKPDFGQHGGMGPYEQSPFLIATGSGFATGSTVEEPSSILDIAPTILAHLGLPADSMAGRALQQGGSKTPGTASSGT